ncbi:hypothetical protein AGDE_00864 [Angomonas deanei]|uniref:RRM domain-containing protein n=1 Tax=Angomonas deanei TaxID=59799 RepID=A0A7G2CUW7_9TRYP|nr:hypothetical protein AGDE_00864 [Angomonas deanei]CAD2222213.1 hypothetical protein, conserved [Angomonas deanei]|eukprot:EPY43059.1 hypothetical protein AGDE_00864 [Angomonas deanei]
MGDARVVLLYVDDEEESVSVQDIYNWLTILGAVEEVKPQYDPSTKGICFSVTFKLPVTAQQCVYYLNGAKLKNCLVTMKSSVYRAPSDDASSVKKEEEVQISANLPNNHLMPSELRMDTLLAERLHRLSEGDFEGSAEMIEKLKKLQQQFVAANQKCEALASVPEEPVQKRKKKSPPCTVGSSSTRSVEYR